MRLTWLGHSAFLATSDAGTVAFDPWLTGNPVATLPASQVACDAILVTHGHDDHLGDAVAIARRLNVPVVAVYELATWLRWQGVQAHSQHIGGAHTYPFGTVKFTPAAHGSGIVDEANHQILYCGDAAGILYTAGGKTVWHLGDTALTSDLELVGRRHTIDVALVPIGDNYTMGPEDAAEAVRLIRPRQVVPCHYNTFELLAQDVGAFARLVGGAAEVVALKPGETMEV